MRPNYMPVAGTLTVHPSLVRLWHILAHRECMACRIDPPPTGSRHELEQWMCTLHNRVNRKLDKPAFSCDFVRSRWQPLDCEDPAGCRLAGV